MRSRTLTLLFLAGALVAPAGLLAQVAGLPLRNAGVTRGLTLAADVGFPNDVSGLGTSYGASAGLGLGLVGVSATVARIDPVNRAAGVTALGMTANLRLIGGPLVPFFATLQAGIGRGTSVSVEGNDRVVYSYPVGLGLGWTIASPIVSLRPWLAPRVQWTSTGPAGTYLDTTTRSDPAISGGIDLGFINGISVRGMYDRVFADGDDSSVWSVGLGYSLRILR